jgi:hypothetical protein
MIHITNIILCHRQVHEEMKVEMAKRVIPDFMQLQAIVANNVTQLPTLDMCKALRSEREKIANEPGGNEQLMKIRYKFHKITRKMLTNSV